MIGPRKSLWILPIFMAILLAFCFLLSAGCARQQKAQDSNQLERLVDDVQGNRNHLVRLRYNSEDEAGWIDALSVRLAGQPVSVIGLAVDQEIPVEELCRPRGAVLDHGYTWRVEAGYSLLAITMADTQQEAFRSRCLERLLLDRPYAYKSLIARMMRDIRANEHMLRKLRKMVGDTFPWDQELAGKLPAQPLEVIHLAVELGIPARTVCRPDLRSGEDEWQEEARSSLARFRLADPAEEALRKACLRQVSAALAPGKGKKE